MYDGADNLEKISVSYLDSIWCENKHFCKAKDRLDDLISIFYGKGESNFTLVLKLHFLSHYIFFMIQVLDCSKIISRQIEKAALK